MQRKLKKGSFVFVEHFGSSPNGFCHYWAYVEEGPFSTDKYWLRVPDLDSSFLWAYSRNIKTINTVIKSAFVDGNSNGF